MPRAIARPARKKKTKKKVAAPRRAALPRATSADPLSGFHMRLAQVLGDSSHGEVSRRTGIHAESIRRYRNGFMPSTEFVAATCLAYGISADWLVLGRGQQRKR